MTIVLIIDDEPDTHKVLAPVLSSAGWSVLSAATAAHGVRLNRANRVAIVSLDLGLPDADDKEIIEELQRTKPSLIIVASARNQDSEKVAALDAGADDYVDKPFNIEELLGRVRVAERRPGE